MTTAVSAAEVEAALKILMSFDAKGALVAFQSEDTKAKIFDGLIALDDVAKIVGLFVPPVAVIANDVGIAIAVAEFAAPFVKWLITQPLPALNSDDTPAGQYAFVEPGNQGG